MAASTIPPILIQLQADVSQLKAGLAQATNAIKGVDDTVKKSSTSMNNFVANLKKVGATLGVTFAAGQIVQFGKDSVMAASSMAESLSKVKVVFGEGSDEVIKFGENAAKNMGISNQAALEAAGTYGNLFQAFGLGQGQAQEMSTNLVQLAADMASFNNTSVDDAILALRSGLSGETEPLKRFGVALSEVRLKEEAMRMGLIETMSGTLPVAIKSQAAYSLILKDTALSQGDYARTADGTANTMKTLQAKIADAKVALGDALMPAFRGLLVLLNGLIPVLKSLGTFLKKNQDYIEAIAIGVGVAVSAFVAYKTVMIASATASKVFAVAQVLMSGGQLAAIASTNTLAASILRLNFVMRANPIGLVVTAVALLVAGFVLLWKKSDTFRKAVISMAKVALQAFASIIPMVGKVYEVIMKVVTGPLRALLTVLSKLPGVGKYAKAGLDIMNKGLDGISDFAQGAADKAKSLAASLDKVGAAADKNGKKTDKVTKGGKGKGTGVDPAAAKEAADKAKELLEKQQQAEMDYIEASIKAHESYQEKVADIQKNYNESVTEAQAEHTKEMVDIAKDYAKKKLEIEQDLQDKVTELNKSAAEKRASLAVEATKKQASIVQQSVDRLRSAFASKTGFSLADAFGGGADNADKLLAELKNKLAAAKSLQENAAKLAGLGYSQTFIEEVVKNGPEAGNKIAAALLEASPEATKEMQTLYGQVERISESGLDTLAQTMNAGGRLATQELMDAYSQVAVDLKDSLAEVDRELQTSLAAAQTAYDKAMNEAKIARDERILEASTTLKQKLAEAQATMDTALADAQKTLQKALLDAQKSYDTAIDQVAATTKAKLAALKIQLAEVAAATAALQGAQAAQAVALASSYTPYITTAQTKPGSTGFIGPVIPSTTVNINGTNLTNPTATATSVVNAIKYGTTVNTTTLAGIAAASASKTTMSGADAVAAARQRNGGYL